MPPIRERHARQPTVISLGYWQLISHQNTASQQHRHLSHCAWSYGATREPMPLCGEVGIPRDWHWDQNLHVLSHLLLIPDLVISLSLLSHSAFAIAFAVGAGPLLKLLKINIFSPEAARREYHSNCNPGCPSNTLTHFMLLGRKHLFLFAQSSFPYKVVLNVQFWVSLDIY